MSNLSLLKNSSNIIKPIAACIKGVHTSPKGIRPKVNVIARLEFKLTYWLQSSTLATTPRELHVSVIYSVIVETLTH